MKLASIEVISGLVPHPNADRLDLARVLGWQVVVRKGEFQVGDRAVFIPIDTLLPSAPWSEFLKDGDKPIRLKTVKLRGQHSQGLLLPLSVLPEHVRLWQDGADVGAELGVKKYEKEVSLALSGVSRGSFPQHLAPRTDEDNGLSNPPQRFTGRVSVASEVRRELVLGCSSNRLRLAPILWRRRELPLVQKRLPS